MALMKWVAMAAAILCFSLLPATATAVSAPKPNIVVIMLDDMPQDVDVTLLSRMPHLAATFLEQGTRFTRFYSNDPLCCPGRTNFLTGLYSHHHGVLRNDGRDFQPRESIATALDREGYFTALSGKYLNGAALLADKTPPGWDRIAFSIIGYDSDWYAQGVRKTGGFQPDLVADYGVKYLRRAPASAPVFLYLAPVSTHGGSRVQNAEGWWMPDVAPRHLSDPRCAAIGQRVTPAWNESDVSDKPAWLQALKPLSTTGYELQRACRSLLSVDDMFAKVEYELSIEGRLANTMFVLLSDNGMGWGDHRLFGKSTPYSTHLPLMVNWYKVPPGTNDSLLSMVDLAPTLVQIAGGHIGPYPTGQLVPDGVDARKALFLKQPVNDALLEEHHVAHVWYALRTLDWHYVEWANGELELYDSAADPWELVNVASDPAYADVVADLHQRLAANIDT